MAYEIATIRAFSEVTTGNAAKIDIYNWGGEYRPASQGTLCFLPGQGFAVRMQSAEENPRAVQTAPNSQVCEDSCLEFFVDFAPDTPGSGYVNFEGNARGTMLCHYGPALDAGVRRPVTELGCEHPRPHVFRGGGFWGWELLIPLEFIQKIYGKAEFGPGSRICGNFFKCGDLTEHPHYGSYTKIDWPQPSFHRPQFFADMTIVG